MMRPHLSLRLPGLLHLLGLALCACGGAAAVGPSSFEPLRTKSDAVVLEAGVKGPRLVPESVTLERTFGVEPGGGVRGIAGGVRVVSFTSGAVLSAADRLAQMPTSIVVLPERFGGGVVFALGDTLWRAERWLARAEPIFRAPAAIRSVWVGLDRVLLKLPSGAVLAVHPTTGAPLDLGALPPSPSVTAFAALDGFRAIALADLRGVVATTDAGASWRTLALPIEPKTLSLDGDTVTVGSGREVYEVRPEGDFGRVESKARVSAEAARAAVPSAPSRASGAEGAERLFGPRPLATAVTDGAPLSDGTVLVARDGALARVRLVDGAIVDVARDAFPLRASRCRAIPLGRGDVRERAGIGFVCGEPQGRTHLYAYSRARGGLDLVKAWGGPRAVLPGGSGALAVRGRCAESAPSASLVPGAPLTEMTYCVRDADGNEREQILTAYVESARVVALRDGALAVIAPPRGDIGGGHVTIATRAGAKTVKISFEVDEAARTPPRESDAARRVLTQGMWLEGFEEREPGVLAGWVEHAGTMLGVEVRLDGRGRHGAFVRDAGTVMVSGRFGLGWTSASRGYETIDGGLTWRAVELPEPIKTASASAGLRSPAARGCSAAGCVLEGWIRVGYGDAVPPAVNPAHTFTAPRASSVPLLELSCDLLARGRAERAPASRVRPSHLPLVTALSGSLARGAGEFTPFYSMPAPDLHAEEVGTTFEVQELVDHARPGLLARAYVWGAKGIEWDTTSKWAVRWTSPFASSSDVFSSGSAKPPRAIMEAARFAASAGAVRTLSSLTLATADDPRHALLVVSRAATPPQAVESFAIVLDDARAPVEVRRQDGETFGRIEGALRNEGRWFLLAEPDTGEPSAAVLWEVDSGIAREVVRVPRVVDGTGRPSAVRLAKRDGESTLGLVAEGPPPADRTAATRWVVGVDVGSGRASEVELLGTVDFGGKGLSACGGDDGGWAFDVPLTGQPIRALVAGKPAALKAGYGRVRVSRGRSCLDRLSAVYDGAADDLKPTGRPSPARNVEVGLLTGLARQELRCGK